MSSMVSNQVFRHNLAGVVYAEFSEAGEPTPNLCYERMVSFDAVAWNIGQFVDVNVRPHCPQGTAIKSRTAI